MAFRKNTTSRVSCRKPENADFGILMFSHVKNTTSCGISKRDTERLQGGCGRWGVYSPVLPKKSRVGNRKNTHRPFGRYASGFALASAIVPTRSALGFSANAGFPIVSGRAVAIGF